MESENNLKEKLNSINEDISELQAKILGGHKRNTILDSFDEIEINENIKNFQYELQEIETAIYGIYELIELIEDENHKKECKTKLDDLEERLSPFRNAFADYLDTIE